MRHRYVSDARSMLETCSDFARAFLTTECTDRSIRARLMVLYIHARAASDYGTFDAVEAEFMQLARDTGLIAALGRSGEQDIKRIITSAMRGESPFT